MLILSRKVGESLLIADDIVVTVLEVRGKQVRIGIKARDDVTILREELAVGVVRKEPQRVPGISVLDQIDAMPRAKLQLSDRRSRGPL